MNSSILKIAGEDALQQNIVETKEYVNARTGVWTTPITCAIGDTNVTITDSSIQTNSVIRVQSQTSSGKPLAWTTCVATTGQAVINFKSALTESTDVRLQIINL